MTVKVKRLILLLLCLIPLVLGACGDSSPTRALHLSDPIPPDPTPTTFSLSGTLSATAVSAVDSDTNNPAATAVSNNKPADAQALTIPVVVGGYIVRVATGVAGDQFATVPDDQDWYRITLAAGQTVSLTIADHDGVTTNASNPDFDLFLVNPTNLLDVQTSEGLGPQETISVLIAGDYLVQVVEPSILNDPSANATGSNYTLSVGVSAASAPSTTAASLHFEDDFIPGEVIVKFRDSALMATPQAQVLRATTLGLVPVAGRAGEARLYRFSTVAPAANFLASRVKGQGDALYRARRATLDQVKALRRRSDVEAADLNYVRRPFLQPNDSFFSSQWQAPLINLPQAWDITTGDPNLVVAVLDSGILFEHPDLVGRLCLATDDCAGYDFIADPVNAADGDGLDVDPADPGAQDQPDGSSSFHGTHVAGIFGASANNSQGIAGVDWSAKIMPLRVLGLNGGSSFDIMQALRYAAGLTNDSNSIPLKTARVVNLSLGGGGFSAQEQTLFDDLYAAGILVVAAAGNETSSIPSYPAAYNHVVSVGAVDISKNLAFYSNTGVTIDLVAPGGDQATNLNGDGFTDGILSTIGDDHTSPIQFLYAPYEGTSMAAPQVAGVAALMMAVDPAFSPVDFDVLLAGGQLTEDLGGDGLTVRNDSFGYGLIDAQKALLAALDLAGGGILPPSLAITPSLLQYGQNDNSLSFSLANAGGGQLRVVSIVSDQSWLSAPTLTNETLLGSGLGDYNLSVVRTSLAAGVYSGSLTLTTDPPQTYSLPVLLQVGGSGAADAALQRIDLLDALSGSVLQTVQVAVDPLTGTYPYSFIGLAAGSYRVNSSSDMDNDGMTCDAGESCGSYPLLSDPATVQIIDQNLINIDFSSGF